MIFYDWSGSYQEHEGKHEEEHDRKHSNQQDSITHVLDPRDTKRYTIQIQQRTIQVAVVLLREEVLRGSSREGS